MQRSKLTLSRVLPTHAKHRLMALAKASLAHPRHRTVTFTVTGALFAGDSAEPRPYANVAGPRGARINYY